MNNVRQGFSTVLVRAAEQRLALGARTHAGGGRHGDSVHGPFLQPLQLDLVGAGLHRRLLRRLLRGIRADLGPAAHHRVAHYVPGQHSVLAPGRRRAPTYQQGGGAGAGALNVLRGGRGLCSGLGRGERRGGKQKTKRWEREKENDKREKPTEKNKQRHTET